MSVGGITVSVVEVIVEGMVAVRLGSGMTVDGAEQAVAKERNRRKENQRMDFCIAVF
jgi:hypothetical protein